MITAKEARIKSGVIRDVTKYMIEIEEKVEKNVERGETSAFISHNIMEKSGDKLRNAIVSDLTELGYKVEFKYAREKPLLCPDSQWDYNNNNGEIIIHW